MLRSSIHIVNNRYFSQALLAICAKVMGYQPDLITVTLFETVSIHIISNEKN